MESEGKAPADAPGDDATRSDGKRADNGDGISPAERAARDAKGRFGKGNQAAVGFGRPKKDFDIETACMAWTPDIVEHFGYQGTIAQTGAQVEMGKAVLAYHLGKPRVRIEHSGPGGGPMELTVRTTEQKRARLREIQRGAAARIAQVTQAELPGMEGDGDAGDEQGPEDAAPDGAPGSQ